MLPSSVRYINGYFSVILIKFFYIVKTIYSFNIVCYKHSSYI